MTRTLMVVETIKRKMNMKKLKYLLLVALSLQLAGCGRSEIDSWNSSLVWFTDTLIDFTNMAQSDVPMGGTLTIAVPLTIAADLSDKDRTVNVEVAKQPNDSRTSFELQTPVVIRANHTADTLYVNLVNSEHLDEVYDTLAIRVLPSEDFEPGLLEYQEVKICLHNGYLRPEWWDDDAERHLGYFTQLKMQVFETVTGGLEDPRSNTSYWDSNDLALQYVIYQLNDYIENNDIRYPDDDQNAPGEQPSFSWKSY